MLNLNFLEPIQSLGANAAFDIANSARPAGDYALATFLPEMLKTTYEVRSGTMTIRPTMAGLAAMDGPYPPGGFVDISVFLAESAKIANNVTLPEATLREIQNLVMNLMARGGAVRQTLVQEVLNFLNKVVIQAHMDTMEWLRGQALSSGAINWTFNKKNLVVNYGIPTANILTPRTGNDSYDGSTSKFWVDVLTAEKRLNYTGLTVIGHPTTINGIIGNTANTLEVLDDTNAIFRVRKFQSINSQNVPSSDARERLSLVAYGLEGEVFDTTVPGTTKKVPFLPVGKLIFIGANNSNPAYRVGQGATEDVNLDLALGYTHLAPTVEGGGAPGRWARVYVPEGRPYQLTGEGVTNGLPVIEAPAKLVIAQSDIT